MSKSSLRRNLKLELEQAVAQASVREGPQGDRGAGRRGFSSKACT
jgi:hypothetical protein